MCDCTVRICRFALLAAALAVGCTMTMAFGQAGITPALHDRDGSAAPGAVTSSSSSSAQRTVSPFIPKPGENGRARVTYAALWGIDRIDVSEASSGAFLRFSYRVVDAAKAKALHDERSTPYLIDQKSGAVLQVPNLPKVGDLRSKMTPENGKEYWMVFSNKGFVKPGSRVNIVIGSFRAEGLVVRGDRND